MEGKCPNCGAAFEFSGVGVQRIRCKKCHAQLDASAEEILDKTLGDWVELLYRIGGTNPLLRFWRWVFFFAMLSWASVALFMLVDESVAEDATLQWPMVEGVVLASEVRQSGSSFYPDMRYEYVVNGKKYEGTRLTRVENGERNFAKVNSEVSRFTVGANVKVYFDPADPKSAVLTTGAKFANVVMVGIYLLAIALMAGLVGVMWMTSSPRRLVVGVAPLRRMLDKLA